MRPQQELEVNRVRAGATSLALAVGRSVERRVIDDVRRDEPARGCLWNSMLAVDFTRKSTLVKGLNPRTPLHTTRTLIMSTFTFNFLLIVQHKPLIFLPVFLRI